MSISTIGTLLKRGGAGGEWKYDVQGLMGTSYVSHNFGVTQNIAPGSGQDGAGATENGLRLQKAGIVSKMYVWVYANTLDAACVVTVRLQKADTPITVTIGAGLTGAFNDIANTAVNAADDELTISSVVAGTAGSIKYGVTVVWTITTAGANTTKTYAVLIQGNKGDAIAFGLTRNCGPYGFWASTTEGFFPIPVAGTIKALMTRIGDTNTLNGVCLIRVRKNAVNATSLNTVIVGERHITYCDMVNTDAFAAGDRLSFRVDTTAAGAGDIQIESITCVFEVP